MKKILPLVFALVATTLAHAQQWVELWSSNEPQYYAGEAYIIVPASSYPSINIPTPVDNYGDAICGGFYTFAQSYVVGGQTYYKLASGQWKVVSGSCYTMTILLQNSSDPNPAPPPVSTWTITTSVQGSGSISGADGSFTDGSTATLTANSSAGWRFDHWEGDLSGSNNPASLTMNANKSVKAVFAQNTYTLNVYTNGSGSASGGGSYAQGTTATATAYPGTGYHFTGWSGDAGGSSNPCGVYMDNNKTIYANFSADNYTLSTGVSPAGAGSVGGGGNYSYGTTATITAYASAGYHFTGWSGDAGGTTNPVGVYMDRSKAATANFAINTYTVTTGVNPAGTGSVSGGGSYNHGSTATLTASPNTGYHFTGWSGDAGGSANPTTLTVDANKNVTANFAINTYTVTTVVSPAGSGSITGGGTYNYGSTATVTATPAAGYYFTGWSGAVTGSTNPASITVNADKTVTATFAQIPPPTASISASPTTGWAPLTSTITWASTNADTVTVAGPSFSSAAASGTQALNLSAVGTYTYTVTAKNVNGTATDTVTISVQTATFTLTTSASGSGSVSPGGVYPRPNPTITAVTIVATPTTSTRFAAWFGDTTGTISTTNADGTASLYVPMTSDRSITGNFIAKLTQTISFANPGTRSLKNGAFALVASASSGLPVTFVVNSGPAVVSGNILTPKGEGMVTVTAYQPGNTVYLAATPVSVSFLITNPPVTTMKEKDNGTAINDGQSEERNFGR